MSLVLDSSIALSWCFEDEQTPATLALLQRVAETGAAAPSLWPLEVLNALAMAVRRNRLATDKLQQLAALLGDLPVRLDDETTARAWRETSALASKHRLTLYDAAYLELALRSALPLASLDAALVAAAQSEGVTTLGL